jgi:hypothetical protein
MHMTVRAAATAIFPVKLGFRLESAKSIPGKIQGLVVLAWLLLLGVVGM